MNVTLVKQYPFHHRTPGWIVGWDTKMPGTIAIKHQDRWFRTKKMAEEFIKTKFKKKPRATRSWKQ